MTEKYPTFQHIQELDPNYEQRMWDELFTWKLKQMSATNKYAWDLQLSASADFANTAMECRRTAGKWPEIAPGTPIP